MLSKSNSRNRMGESTGTSNLVSPKDKILSTRELELMNELTDSMHIPDPPSPIKLLKAHSLQAER